MEDSWRDRWLEFIDGVRFPVEVMRRMSYGMTRDRVDNVAEYVEYLDQWADRTSCFVGHRGIRYYYTGEHWRAYIDIDAENVESVIPVVESLYAWIGNTFGGTDPLMTFSGRKGFHLHFTHEPLDCTTLQYRESWKRLLREAFSAEMLQRIDWDPLGDTRRMPRLPYSLHAGSVSKYGQAFYCVPVEMPLDYGGVISDAREPPVRSAEVPEIRGVGKALREVMPSETVDEGGNSASQGRVRELSEEVVNVAMNVAPYLDDGVKRYLRHLVVPGHLNLTDDPDVTMRNAREFVEASGNRWPEYRSYVRSLINSARQSDGWLIPMRLDKFFSKYPDLVGAAQKG